MSDEGKWRTGQAINVDGGWGDKDAPKQSYWFPTARALFVDTMSNDESTPTIDEALVHRLINQQFPQWAGLQIKAVEPSGWDNRTFRLGEQMTARLPSAAAYTPQVKKEQRWLPELARHLPQPIPEPIALGVPGEGYPWHWSVLSWIEGKTASLDVIDDLRGFAQALADFLTALQNIPTSGGPIPGQTNFYRGGQLRLYDAETRDAMRAISGRINAEDASVVWEKALASYWEQEAVWVHGDVTLNNLLVHDGRLCGVIDFGNMAVGDPACDLTIAWTDFSDKSREVFRAALPFDNGTWERARGWALWKALITVANSEITQAKSEACWRTIAEVIADYHRHKLN